MMRPDIYGLAVCGGASSRMGMDKSMICYYEKPQRYHVADLLMPLCRKIYLSLNDRQSNGNEAQYPSFTDLDAFRNTGPAAALLTAATLFPDTGFIAIGCDYPLLQQNDLEDFICGINAQTIAQAFYNREADCYEPLLAYYSAAALQVLVAQQEQDRSSLQQLLRQLNAGKHFPADPLAMQSADTPEEREAMLQQLKQRRH